MKKTTSLLILFSVLVGILVACGTTPEPTKPPPTQTPHFIIVTTTPGAETQPTNTPWVVVATATPTKKTQPTATKQVVTRTPTAITEREATETPTETPASPTAGTPAETPASPTATVEPTTVEPTPTESATTPVPVTPTNTPGTVELKYPPPVLLDPPNNRPVSWKSTVLLVWSSVGELDEDEYYHVHLERPPKTEGELWYGDYLYTKETEVLVEGAFLAPFHLPAEYGHGVVYWWVRVVRKTGEDDSGKPIGIDIGAPSEKRTFITEPKPEGQ